MAEREKRSGCYRFGCCGCFLAIAAAVALMILVAVTQFARGTTDRPLESRDLVRALPAMPTLEELQASGELASAALPMWEDDAGASMPGLGRVVVDLHVGDFEIRAGDSNQPIRVEAEYEEDAFELVESFRESDDGGFVYEVRFRPKGGMIGMLLRGAGNNPRNEVEIVLPRGRPLDVVGELGIGESRVDLGGLWIRDVHLVAGTGEHVIELSEPLQQPMRSLRVEKGTGEMRLEGLGYASPALVDVDMRIGDLRVDLSGSPWRTDSLVRVDLGIGESQLRLPLDARVEVDRTGIGLGERRLRGLDAAPSDAELPLVRLDLGTRLGELRVDR